MPQHDQHLQQPLGVLAVGARQRNVELHVHFRDVLDDLCDKSSAVLASSLSHGSRSPIFRTLRAVLNTLSRQRCQPLLDGPCLQHPAKGASGAPRAVEGSSHDSGFDEKPARAGTVSMRVNDLHLA